MRPAAAAANDTIVAVATPPGRGGVGIVRMSGPRADALAERVCGSLPEPRQASLRAFRAEDGSVIDRGLVLLFEAPASFTGETVVELHAHGGPTLLSLLVQALCRAGARPARAGEFTERAYLNGRLDLAQAEAVADLIEATSEAALRAAARTLDGGLSAEVGAITAALDELRVWTEAAIDFPEEEIDFLADPAAAARLDVLRARLHALRQRTQTGLLLRDGVRLVIAGRPNVGKSTLLNALVGRDAAIVTDRPGTTRDLVQARATIGGVVFELTDTAGVRDSEDVVERIGVERAREAMRGAELLLLVMDDREPWLEEERRLAADGTARVVAVLNKIDRSGGHAGMRAGNEVPAVGVCARGGQGLDDLRALMLETAVGPGLDVEQGLSARARHLHAIDQAAAALARADDALRTRRAGELLAEELRLARGSLGAIVGEQSSDELLGRIFSSFCIGK